MAPKAKGSIWRTPEGLLYARITVKDVAGATKRPWISLDPKLSDEQAKRLALKMTQEAKGKVWDPAEKKREERLTETPTVDDYVEKLWLPSRLGKVKSIRTDRYRYRLHISPVIGKKRLADVTPDDLRELVQRLDEKADDESVRFGAKTAICCWAIVSRMFADMVDSKKRELRVLKKNPAAGVAPPDPPGELEKQWLYPSELQLLLACADVPVERRQIYAATVFLVCRPGEALALLWKRGVDPATGMVRIYRSYDHIEAVWREHTKSGDSRHFAMDSVIRPMFEAMIKRRTEELVFPVMSHLAENLRADLLKAGVDRAALHVPRKGARVMRFHDLRATGITYLAIRGDTDNQIRERAGHTDFKTTQIYIRRGHLAAGAVIGDPFAPLPAALSGIVQEPSSGAAGSGAGGAGGTDQVDNAAIHSAVATSKEFESLLPLNNSHRDAGASPGPLDESLDDSTQRYHSAEGAADPFAAGLLKATADRGRRLAAFAEADPKAGAPGLAMCRAQAALLAGDVEASRAAIGDAYHALGLDHPEERDRLTALANRRAR